MLGKGDGTFLSPTVYPAGSSSPKSVAAADVNNDGLLDLVIANDLPNAQGTVTALLGNGDGTLQLPTYYGTGLLA